ncbi:MAG TPA: SGNH/GDSL hydrolase family protein [Patescibacteria group bacterium]|nr:SGNH/GDSL hydrolase family protein [Patescibacteria group bacterium]
MKFHFTNGSIRKLLPSKYHLLLSIFSIFITLALLEIVLQIDFRLKQKFQSSPVLTETEEMLSEYENIEYEYRPYILWRAKPNVYTKYYSTNSLGLRGNEFQKEKSPNVFRIILLGGSAAWGYDAGSNENTISVQLENILQKQFSESNKKIEIYNFAESGYTSSQEIILWNEISDYNPDLVIHYTGYNDIFAGVYRLKPGWNHHFIQEDLILSKDNWHIIFTLLSVQIDTMLQNFRLYDLIKGKFFSAPRITSIASNGTRTYSNLGEIANIFVKNMFFSQQIAKSKNIRFLIVLQPSIFTDQKILTNQEKKIFDEFNTAFPLSANYFRDGYQDLANGLTQLDIPFMDGSTFFKDEQNTIYYDTVHYTDTGNTQVAESLANLIISEGLLDK